MIMRVVFLFVIVVLPGLIAALTGRTCTIRNSKSENYRTYQSARRSQRYSTSCGFLGLSRCTRYRDYYVHESVSRVRTVYYASTICCVGWRVDSSGTNCNIHDKNPTIVSCPKNEVVRATGKVSRVTWQKPEFKEPFGYKLKVTSKYGGEEAQLPWGDTNIAYVATSQNNNKQVRCAFTITVIPPKPEATITGFGRGESVKVDEHERLVLECRAEYGKPPPALAWFRKGSRISVGTSYRTVNSDYLDYKHAINTVTLNPTRRDDGVTYECRTTPDVTKYSIKMAVTYEVYPTVSFCPANISRESNSRQTLVSWPQPTFVDPRYNEPVDVVGSLGPVTHRQLGWGDHRVTYTGTNRRNKLTATCEFTITIQPPACDDSELVTENGAMVCSYWPEHYSRLCKPFCLRDFDVIWLDRAPELYVCDVTGRWMPSPLPLNCSQPRLNIDSVFLPSRDHYFTGSCSVSRGDLKSSFLKTVVNSPFKPLCDNDGCGESLVVTVSCS